MHVDIHQHVWPGALIEELRRRSQPPRLDGWTLLTACEPPFVVNPADHDVGRRAALGARDGAGRVVIGLSSPLGIEYLVPEEAEPLLDAYHRGVIELGAPFAGWAAACLAAIDASDLAKQLDRGFVGLQLPATALADESGYRWCSPLLDVLAERDLPPSSIPGPWPGRERAARRGGPPSSLTFSNCTRRGSRSVPTAGRPTHGYGSASLRWQVSHRCMASAWPPVAEPTRWRGVWSTRTCSSKHPAMAIVLSTPYSVCSALTCSYLAPTGHMRSPIPILASAALPAMRSM